MLPAIRAAALAAALLAPSGLGAQTAAPDAGAEDESALSVTSDTLPWCQHLAAKFGLFSQRAPAPHDEADELARRGAQMCATGHVRVGILWLRHALAQLSSREP